MFRLLSGATLLLAAAADSATIEIEWKSET